MMVKMDAQKSAGGGIDGVYYEDGTWSSAQDGVAIDLGFTPLTITFYNILPSNQGVVCNWSAADPTHWSQSYNTTTNVLSLGQSPSSYRPSVYAVSGTTVTIYGHTGQPFKLVATKM